MAKTIILIKTWRCDKCTSPIDFEPTEDNYKIHFPELGGVYCPNKGVGCDGKMKKVTEPKLKSKLTIDSAEDSDIDTHLDKLDISRERDNEPNLTKKERDDFKIQKKKDVAEAIVRARKVEDK